MMDATHSSETSVLTRDTWLRSPKNGIQQVIFSSALPENREPAVTVYHVDI
jgi:hypothetical protein